ncbi:DNA-binding protein [Aestuariicella hydrocarbonica]|uniref:DNA-binding protein n=1 Tax=Pseudomaricurvus hydrocarbonicus TaxID=1470433 RepID=A0A9E5JUZ9_9GAMM|nr:OB-fold domain-containing protein [Aestuariicella hydrocarbonica]NHO65956.1 DNA-binding protein [Aestuariicella hydrocarbonica]
MSNRPLPRLDSVNRDFWTCGADSELRLQHCNDCQQFFHPPRPVCRHCLSENVGPKAVAGTGVVDTYTVNYQKWHPAIEVPFIIARIAIDGAPGVYLTSNVIGCEIDDVDIGDKVQVTFELQDDVYLPLFEKVS